jgi:hypothetical protein
MLSKHDGIDQNKIDIRQQYLLYHGVCDPEHIVFVDTGFEGKVPESILKYVFGKDNNNDYIDKRILNISSDNPKRRIPQDWYKTPEIEEAVRQMEYAPQPRQQAFGLFHHSSGKLKPFGQSVGILNEFKHDLVRFVIARHFHSKLIPRQLGCAVVHYWLQGRVGRCVQMEYTGVSCRACAEPFV